jgi:integrase
MPRRSKGPRLYWKKSERGRTGEWLIRDGTHREGTGVHCERDREQAEPALAAYITSKYTAPKVLGQDVFIDEVIAYYLDESRHKPSFKDHIVYTAKPIVEWWSGKKVSDVNKATCNAYVRWRTLQLKKRHPNSKRPPQKISLATARHDLKTLRAAIRAYRDHDNTLIVPPVKMPKKPAPRLNYFLTRKEIADRLRAARRNKYAQHLVRVILIGVYSGTRPMATRRLLWVRSKDCGWIDLEGGILHRRGTDQPITNKQQTPCRIHWKLLPFLRRWRSADMRAGVIHVIHEDRNYKGKPIKKLRRSWATAREAAAFEGEDHGAHILRHTAATWLMQDGVDPFEAAGYLGMTVDTLMAVYGHHHPNFQKAAASFSGKKRRA